MYSDEFFLSVNLVYTYFDETFINEYEIQTKCLDYSLIKPLLAVYNYYQTYNKIKTNKKLFINN